MPSALAFGGLQIQMERTRQALSEIGVDVEYCKWYDASQRADVLHFYGRIPGDLCRLAQKKGTKVVMLELLTAQGSRSKFRLSVQSAASGVIRKLAPRISSELFDWSGYQLADACIANTAWERYLMHDLFGAPQERLHIVPNGVEKLFLESPAVQHGKWLVCTATITERKRVLELAKAAVTAKTPLWVVGKPYHESDQYFRQFVKLVKKHQQLLRYEGGISDRARLARIYREAHGFVLLSSMETLSLSADEAAACQAPILLSDLPWARVTFGDSATYCPIAGCDVTAQILGKFYKNAPNLPRPRLPPTWTEVARQFKAVYEKVLKS